MDALGAQEIMMPALQPKEPWITTDRWDKFDVLFKIKKPDEKGIRPRSDSRGNRNAIGASFCNLV